MSPTSVTGPCVGLPASFRPCLTLDRAVDLAVRLGGIDAAQRKLEALEAEKREVLARLECAPMLPDFEALEAVAVDRVQQFRALFDESPSDAHRALRALLAGERIRVHADAALGFRVEGTLSLPLINEAPGAVGASGRFDLEVAGV